MLNNQMTRRQLLAGMGAGVSVLALTACVPVAPGAAPAAGSESAAPATEPLTLTLWSSFGGALGEAETALVGKFAEAHGGEITLDYQFQGSYEETAQKVTAALQAQTAPDVSLLSDVWWFKFYLNQVLLPLDDLAASANIDFSDFQDSLINEAFRQEKHWWMPFARSTPLFYYNREMWAAAGLPDRGPETWDEFMEWAPKLVQMEGDEMKVSAFVHPDGASYIAWLFQGVAWQFGGKYSDPDFTMHMTDEKTVAAGQFYKDTVHEYKWARPAKDITADFINGLSAAMMASTGGLSGIRKNATFDFGTALLPKKDNFGCCTGGAGLAILSSCPEEKRAAAMTYIDFATNPEITTFWSQNTGYMPVRKSSATSEAMTKYYAEFPQFETAVKQLELTQPQDAARVFVPNGDQIIGKGLERITVTAEEVAAVFAEVNETLTKEAEPVVQTLQAIEG
jgi:sn-glycerol 3-phosphate transport system substrate-binding protein